MMERTDLGTTKLPLFRQYATTLMERISAGVYAEKLPPEPDLVKESQLSRGTVRAALAILEANGTITRFSGRGTFINTNRSRDLLRESIEIEELGLKVKPYPEHPFMDTLLRLTTLLKDTTIPETVKGGLVKVISAQLDLVEQLRYVY